MRAIHLLLAGCVLGLGFAAPARAATTVDAGCAGAADCGHAGASSDNGHDGGVSGGDVVDLRHGSGSHADAATSGKGGGDSVIRSGGGDDDDAAPAHAHAANLGWQSLLPGSIQ